MDKLESSLQLQCQIGMLAVWQKCTNTQFHLWGTLDISIFIHPMALSTWVCRWAIFQPSWTSNAGNCIFPYIDGGRFNSTLRLRRTSLMVKPLSAIIEMPGLSVSFVRNPERWVSSTSEIDSTYTGDTNDIAPLGVQATRNLAVFLCLYSLQVEDCRYKSDGVSKMNLL